MKITNEITLNWLRHLQLENYAENTIGNYFTDLKLFLEFLMQNRGVESIDSDEIQLIDIDEWKQVLHNTMTPKTSIYYAVKPTLSQATIQTKLTAIKSFMKFLNYYYNTWLDYRKITTKRIKSDYIECLTEEEYNTFLNHISDYETYKINALRSQLLCNIAYTSWLRLSEILGLTIEEIKSKETRITWKGNKTRRVFFTPSTENLLEQYLEERSKPIPRTWIQEHQSDFVFISHNSGYDYWNPIKKNTICEKIKKYSDTSDLWKRVTVHSLRHSYATKLLENWLNIREIQELLGHCDIQTTQGYCHVLKNNLSEKVSQIFS